MGESIPIFKRKGSPPRHQGTKNCQVEDLPFFLVPWCLGGKVVFLPFIAKRDARHPLKTISLRVDVDTLEGSLAGIPTLLRLLDKHRMRASFYFSFGPDNSGKAIRRIFRKGFLAKMRRTNATKLYGLKTMLYGVLLPAPIIWKQAATQMLAARAASARRSSAATMASGSSMRPCPTSPQACSPASGPSTCTPSAINRTALRCVAGCSHI